MSKTEHTTEATDTPPQPPAVVAPFERELGLATSADIRRLASATLDEHGMQLVAELNKGGTFDGGNLCALLEVFGEKLLSAERARWTDAVMAELDSNGQAHAIVAAATRA